jgi:hypothetical protein
MKFVSMHLGASVFSVSYVCKVIKKVYSIELKKKCQKNPKDESVLRFLTD